MRRNSGGIDTVIDIHTVALLQIYNGGGRASNCVTVSKHPCKVCSATTLTFFNYGTIWVPGPRAILIQVQLKEVRSTVVRAVLPC